MKRCYYEILQVDKKAPAGQIKTAYRKMALKCHPDKNPSDDAKKMFLQVQEAYDVLADPNERTFYDSNRQRILFNKDQMSKQDLQHYSFGFNIWPYFTAKCYKGFSDETGCFFQVYREVFENIKAEQAKAFKARDDLEETMRKFEGFGVSDTIMEKVISFYEDWQNFTTYKSFSWIEEHDTREAQNRWVKRRMIQQNKKQRLKQKRMYIKTIKDLLSFMKKRDPRFQKYIFHLKQVQQRKQKQKLQKIQDKKKQKQNMKKSMQTIQELRFKQIQQYHKKNSGTQVGSDGNAANVDYQTPQFYCRLCQKLFKSQNQYVNHQKSKAHKRYVRLIQKEVIIPQQTIDSQQTIKQAQKQQINETVSPVPTKKKRFRKKKNKNNDAAEQNINDNQDDKKDAQIESTQKQAPGVQEVFQPINAANNKQEKEPSDQEPEVSKKKSSRNRRKNKQVPQNNKKQEPQTNTKQEPQNNKIQQPQNKKKQQPQNKKKKQQPSNKKKQASSDQSESSQQDILTSLAQNRSKNTANTPQSDQQNKGKKGKGKKKNPVKQQVKNASKNAKPADDDSDQEQGQEKKLGKAKLKKMKKGEQQKQSVMKCKTCGSVFVSKSKLFDHIKQSGHAATK